MRVCSAALAGLLVLSAAFADNEKADLKLMLPEGHKAYVVKLPADSQVDGFILPGSKVDVLVAEKLKDGKAKTSRVLEDVLVVIVDTQPVKDERKKADPGTLVVTLAVKEKDFDKLTEAEKKGAIRLVLRKPDEPAVMLPEGYKAYAIQLPMGDPSERFFVPGAKVDVLLVEKTDGDKVKSSAVVHDLLVVAMDGRLSRDDKKKADVFVTTVTLAVKEKDLEKLTEAATKGSLRLLLRQRAEPAVALPEGHKAYALKLPRADVILVRPGSKVFILVDEKTKDNKSNVSAVLDDNLLVVDTELADADANLLTITLAVKEKDLEKLAAAQKKGEIRLVLTKVDRSRRAYVIKLLDNDLSTELLKPESRVDVLLVEKAADPKAKPAPVLQNIRIVAIDTQVVKDDKKKADTETMLVTVTLDVTEQDAEKLAAAEKNGTIRLQLRKPNKPEKVPAKPAGPAR